MSLPAYLLTFVQRSDFQHYSNPKPLAAFSWHLITKHHYHLLLPTNQTGGKTVDDGISSINTTCEGVTLHFSNSRRSRSLFAFFYIAIIIITDHRCCNECTDLWLHLQSEQRTTNQKRDLRLFVAGVGVKVDGNVFISDICILYRGECMQLWKWSIKMGK